MLHTFRSHRPQFLRARNKTQCSKANEKDFSVSLAASLSAQMPTSHSEHDRSGAWMHFSTPGICWGCHTGRCSWLSTPCGTGVASQLFTGSEISKPVLQVRFTKHLPTSLMLTVAAPLLPYHGRLCTSFPGAKLSKGQIFSGSSVRYETRALTHYFVKCSTNLSQTQAVKFQCAVPQNSWQWSHTCMDANGSCSLWQFLFCGRE